MDRSNEAPAHWSNGATDFLQLDRSDARPGDLAGWLATAVREAVLDGRLPAGATLPATRTLAAELDLARGTVTEAYRRLAETGEVEGRGRAGTVVVGRARPAAAQAPAPAPTRARALGAAGPPDVAAFAGHGSVFDELRAARPEFDLVPGVPDLAGFPRAAWLRAERRVLDELPARSLAYGDPRGEPALRTEVATWLARYRGLRVDPAQVVVVAGVAQALALLAHVLRTADHDAIAVEDPGSFGARELLAWWGVATPPVGVDERGLRVDDLRATGAGVVLVTPAHQFPLGVVLDGARRRELTDWAADGGLVIEDDYDAEHRYDRRPVAAVAAAVPGSVVYTGSLSKLVAPSLRIGWLVAPPQWHEAIVEAKRQSDLGNAVVPQLVVASLLASGELERHLRLARSRYRRRRDATVAALSRDLPHGRILGAAAGLHLTVTFDDAPALDDVALARAALERGVAVHPLSWYRQRPGVPGFVLGYGASGTSRLDAGVRRLAEAVRDR
ncbi:PLP-dependent aminotransferase family protein [Luteimicrobium sp. NPDC057192]|uniref:MocR-like pyridoxine biosynthesis transcription factor PdxR n=1 Tax=Luteimicrobium sp. NPDC057192 TaxID=3346042 RepID=UPI00362A8E2B